MKGGGGFMMCFLFGAGIKDYRLFFPHFGAFPGNSPPGAKGVFLGFWGGGRFLKGGGGDPRVGFFKGLLLPLGKFPGPAPGALFFLWAPRLFGIGAPGKFFGGAPGGLFFL
eukprot:FR742996.1.p2 GENE.FR742996.1~~FR742996.1.p2  ORF type:complete len:111 (-),score=60.87 FR742996.1:82-414(-)